MGEDSQAMRWAMNKYLGLMALGQCFCFIYVGLGLIN